MRKKFMAGMLAATLAMGMNTAVFADSEKSPEVKPSLEKTFSLTNPGTTSPAQTFSFTAVECYAVTDSAITDVTDVPEVKVGTIEYAVGEAGGSNKSVSLTVPSYNSVGIYKYKFMENDCGVLGVKCYDGWIYLTVTVTYDSNKNLVADAKVYTSIEEKEEGATKVDNLVNTYSAGSLSVQKNVTGNMGDKKKDFTVYVTFTNSTGRSMNSTISYIVDGEEKKILPENMESGSCTVEIALADQETVKFTNIPYGVTYTVKEKDYADKGYKPALYTYDDKDGKLGEIDSASESVVVTNDKQKGIDTGINLDSMPYLMMMGVACAGMFTFFTKKRMARED